MGKLRDLIKAENNKEQVFNLFKYFTSFVLVRKNQLDFIEIKENQLTMSVYDVIKNSNGKKNITSLSKELGISRVTFYHHLKKLEDYDLIEFKKAEGVAGKSTMPIITKQTINSISKEFQSVIDDLKTENLQLLDQLLIELDVYPATQTGKSFDEKKLMNEINDIILDARLLQRNHKYDELKFLVNQIVEKLKHLDNKKYVNVISSTIENMKDDIKLFENMKKDGLIVGFENIHSQIINTKKYNFDSNISELLYQARQLQAKKSFEKLKPLVEEIKQTLDEANDYDLNQKYSSALKNIINDMEIWETMKKNGIIKNKVKRIEKKN